MNRGLFVLGMLGAVALCPATASAAAQTTTFNYTGGEQTFVMPPGATAVDVVATGAAGGGPVTGFTAAGRGAVVSGLLKVTAGQVLYVEVGGTGGRPAGGFNGGGEGATGNFGSFVASVYGGGGASDVRLVSRSSGGSLASRVIVAAGGGGSADPVLGGGDAGSPGSGSVAGGAGTQTAGGAGGCDPAFPNVGCGTDGSLGIGGDGGTSGTGGSTRIGTGGGGGLYGGGGGGGVLCMLAVGCATGGGEVGSGGGGSSLVPSNGTLSLASLTTPPSIVITPLASVGGTNVPVKGTVKGTITADASTATGMTQAAGQLSALGAATVSEPFQFAVTGFSGSVAQYDATGTTTIIAANGDKLFGDVTGSGANDLVTGDGSGTNTAAITGGTGRFAYATGTLTESYTNSGLAGLPAASGQITVTIQGHISGVGASAVTG